MARAVSRSEPFREPLNAAARIAPSADNDQMSLFEPLRPAEGSVTIEMLNGGLSAASTAKANGSAESATTVGAPAKLSPKSELDITRNLPLICHGIV